MIIGVVSGNLIIVERRGVRRASSTCTSKAKSTYSNPGNIATKTKVGTATTNASALVMIVPSPIARGQRERPQRYRLTAGTKARECCSTAWKKRRERRKQREDHPHAQRIQAAAEWTARIPGGDSDG